MSCTGPAGCKCGGDCCAGITQQTPQTITNPPALSAIRYRTGQYATFLASMLAALSTSSDPTLAPLAALRTRDPSDFSIALLDSWAVVLDILTFYSERLANEAYLRTAIDQRSVTDLAALVGYAPSPGVAASATLAFTLATAPGSPSSVPIPAGTRVQSVPGPGQTAQVFETSSDLTALAAWNALPAQTAQPWSLSGNEQSTWIAGTANNVNVGDALLFVAAPGGAAPTVASDGTSPAVGPVEFHYVTAVQTDPVAKATWLTWEAPLSMSSLASGTAIFVYTFRKKASLYGANAPNPQTLAGPNISQVPGWPAPPGTNNLTTSESTWAYIYTDDSLQVSLDASYPGLVPAAGGPPQWLVMTRVHDTYVQGTHVRTTYTLVTQITVAQDSTPDYYTLTSKVTTVTLFLSAYFINGSEVAPRGRPALDTLLDQFVCATPQVIAYVQSVQLIGAPVPLTDWSDLQQSYPEAGQLPGPGVPGMLEPVAGSAVTVVGGQQVAPGQPAGVSGQRVRLQVPVGAGALFVPSGASEGTKAADVQVLLIDAFPPVLDAAGDATWSVVTVSGVTGTLTIPAGATGSVALLPAAATDPVTGEAVVVSGVTPGGDVTALGLAAPLARIYDAGTVKVNANAVLATNGGTVQEILGSGDATNPALAFTLKQAPLTYVTAAAGSGAQSTLQVWVNNLRWQQTANLLTAGPADRVYTTSMNTAGNTVVQFGNGTQGARPPTGQANIRAVYRTGIGLAGMVGAGQLTQPLDRPQGLSTVTNPSPASPAADPATASEIRASAPLPTLTIGRVVSLLDYQDYALGFTGIAMALATWTWAGSLRGVFLTVAGTNGATLSPTDPIVMSLYAQLRQNGDPNVPLTIVSYEPALFTFAASVAVDTSSYATPAVLAQAWQAVSAAFAFGQRSLGQPVAASEIIGIIQEIPGVIAVQLTALGFSGQPPIAGSVLPAGEPQPPSGAQLLVLDPATQGQIGAWSS